MYFLLILLGWITGIATMGHLFPENYHFYAPIVFILSLIFLGLKLLPFSWKNSIIFHCFSALLFASSSFLLGQFYSNFELQQRLEKRELEVTQVEAVIYIQQINQLVLDDGSGTRIRQKAVVLNQAHSPVLWTLNIKENVGNSDLKLGSYYLVEGKLRPAHSYAVAGVFDVEKWMIQDGVMGTLQVKSIHPLDTKTITAMGYQYFLQQHRGFFAKFRLNIEQKRLDFRRYLYQQPFQQKGLLLALLTGDESLLSKETQQLFKRLGISHLLAISGPHVLIFAILFCFIFNRLIQQFIPKVYLVFPRPYLLLIPFVCCVWLYTAFVGFEIPALRTLLTVLLVSMSLLFQQKLQALQTLLFSAACLLLFDPFSILSAAFWLSYGACFILIRVYQTLQKNKLSTEEIQIRTWRDDLILWFKILIESQWKVFIALFPLVVLIFQQVSWAAPFANLLAIPLIGVFVVPLEVIGAFIWFVFEPLGMLFFQLADWCLQLLVGVLFELDRFMQFSLSWFAISSIQLFLLALAVFILFLPKGIVPKAWSILCVIPLFIPTKENEAFILSVLDVGQGQAIELRLPQQHMLIDTGGYYDESKFSIGEQVIIPYLMQQGTKHLDAILLTHLDQDHGGAFDRIAKEIRIDKVFSNQEDERFKDYHFEYCYAGQSWQYGQVTVEVLSPQYTKLNQVKRNQNEFSCVLYVQVPQAKGFKSFLLMGDAGWEAEYGILQRYPNLKVDVLVLGHHGSQHSSSFAFLKQLKPKLAIASTGFGNHYNHPSPITLARLQSLDIPVMTTIQQGTIQFKLNTNNQMQMNTFRSQKQWLKRDY